MMPRARLKGAEGAESEWYSRIREDLKPLEIVQAEGPSFSVDGYDVRWQKWHFRVGFTSREGLVLHQLAYGITAAPVLFYIGHHCARCRCHLAIQHELTIKRMCSTWLNTGSAAWRIV
jgi:hypothetical protein